MSWSWYIYTTLAPSEVITFDADLEVALAGYLEDHDVDDEYAQHGAGGPAPPRADRVIEYRAQFGEVLAPELLARLAQCRATMSFEYVRSQPDESPLQVSILRRCLERLAPCIMDWGDLSLVLGETVMADLAELKSRGRLGPAPVRKPKPVKRRDARPGEVRALQLLAKLDAAAEDPDAALDVRDALSRLSAPARAYVQLLLDEGAVADAAAMSMLALDAAAFAALVADVEQALL